MQFRNPCDSRRLPNLIRWQGVPQFASLSAVGFRNLLDCTHRRTQVDEPSGEILY